jgi:hypothetical protein
MDEGFTTARPFLVMLYKRVVKGLSSGVGWNKQSIL